MTERNEIYKDLSHVFQESVDNITCQVSEDENTDGLVDTKDVDLSVEISVSDSRNSKRDIFFWSGIVEDTDDDREIFLNEYTNEPIQWDPNIWPGSF